MYTVIQPPGRQRCTVSARPASRSSTSTTTAPPARPHCGWPGRPWRAERSTARSRSASNRWCPAHWAPCTATGPGRCSAWMTARADLQGIDPQAPMAAQFFGGAGQAYIDEFGIDPAVFAEISVKARKHAANNPKAVFRDLVTRGGGAGVAARSTVCSRDCSAARPRAARRRRSSAAPSSPASTTCRPTWSSPRRASPPTRETTFTGRDMRLVIGDDMATAAANNVYETAGVGPEDIQRRRAARLLHHQRTAHL